MILRRVLQLYVRPQDHLHTNHWFESLLITFLQFWCSPLCLYRKKLLFCFFFRGCSTYINPSGLILYDISTTVHFLMLCNLLAKKEKTKKERIAFILFSPEVCLHCYVLIAFCTFSMIIISSVLHVNAPVEQLSTIAPVHEVLLNLRLMLRFLFRACSTQALSSLCKLNIISLLT